MSPSSAKTHLSAVRDEVLNISRAFSRSYYEAVDIDLPGIDVMPIGLTEFYLRDQDYWNILPLLHSPKPSTRRVLAAAGAHWNVTNTDRSSIKTLCASSHTPPEIDCTVSKADWWSHRARDAPSCECEEADGGRTAGARARYRVTSVRRRLAAKSHGEQNL